MSRRPHTESSRPPSVDEAYTAATGMWRRSERGYGVDHSLPLASVQEGEVLLGSGFTVSVSDADEAGQQETLMGNTGMLRFWTEYPHTVEEFQSSRAPFSPRLA